MKTEIDSPVLTCPLPITGHDTIQLAHGSGGQMSNDLTTKLFVWAFGNDELSKQDDSAIISIKGHKLSFSTDSYVVDPIFFPGGNIGELAVNGTINDVSMSGARPICLSCGFIIEEGFPIADLQRIVLSMKRAAAKASVQVVTGDTKVVNRGKGDKVFINTSGIGVIEHEYDIGAHRLQEDDIVILTGTIADHGIAILSQREGLSFHSPIESDTAALNELVQIALQAGGSAIHAFRDPTRGGVAATLNELATSSKVGIRLKQEFIPVHDPVQGACELLGLDPLYVANEGKMVIVVSPDKAKDVLGAVQSHSLGRNAAIIGDVVSEQPGRVQLLTPLGTWRMVDMPVGEQLPRIC